MNMSVEGKAIEVVDTDQAGTNLGTKMAQGSDEQNE